MATGRRPDLVGLGVSSVGLDESARSIAVDGRLRAGPGLWAIGDVTGVGAFTHISMYQARIAAADILGEDDRRGRLPGSAPGDLHRPRDRVGRALTEAAAREAGLTVRTGVTEVTASARGWIHKAGNDGFIKLVADAERGGAGGRHLGRADRGRGALDARPWPSTPRCRSSRSAR